MRRTGLLLVAVSALMVGAWAGCHKHKPDDKPTVNADANSGPDANRSGAQQILPNKDYLDRVDQVALDMTDWKSIELRGKPGPLEVDLRWDNAQADLAVDAFDWNGAPIASSPVNSGVPQKKLLVPIDQLGVYFLRITALTPKAGSDYTVSTKWDTGDGTAPPPPPPPVEKDEPSHPKHHVEHTAPKPHPKKAGSPESGLQGRIVSARREGEGMVLYIDKGRAAGVAEGQNGWILEGASGASTLDGGTFSITSVVDENRSIAKTGLRGIGRNNRVSINTGK